MMLKRSAKNDCGIHGLSAAWGVWGLFCGGHGKSVPLAYQPVNRFAAGSGIGRRYSTDRYSFPTTPFMGHFDGWPTTQPMDITSE